nr:MAG TPA: hypothetical protein [Caudoviricetes sp.]
MGTIEGFFNTDWKMFAITLFAVLLGFQAIVKVVSWFLLDFLGIETKSMRQKREEHNLVMSTANGLKELTETHKKDIQKINEDNLKHYQESCEIRNNLAKSIENISDKIDQMKNDTDKRFKENEAKENKRVQAELKDRISQSYRCYHIKNQINKMELESLEGLIASYESYGGLNSFVHSVVQKEMYTWEVIDD